MVERLPSAAGDQEVENSKLVQPSFVEWKKEGWLDCKNRRTKRAEKNTTTGVTRPLCLVESHMLDAA